jgi:hypothetical protein
MNKFWVDAIFGDFRNYPHDSTVPSADDSDNWDVALRDGFKMLEALFPIPSHVVKKDIILQSTEVKVYAFNLNERLYTSCSTRSLPTPPPDPLLMNSKIGSGSFSISQRYVYNYPKIIISSLK